MELVVCEKCNQQITSGAYQEINGKSYHGACWCCVACGVALGSNPFFTRPEGSFCQDCYNLILAPRCAACSQVINGKVIKTSTGKLFHPEHFICAVCYNTLENYPYREEGGRLICRDCK